MNSSISCSFLRSSHVCTYLGLCTCILTCDYYFQMKAKILCQWWTRNFDFVLFIFCKSLPPSLQPSYSDQRSQLRNGDFPTDFLWNCFWVCFRCQWWLLKYYTSIAWPLNSRSVLFMEYLTFCIISIMEWFYSISVHIFSNSLTRKHRLNI